MEKWKWAECNQSICLLVADAMWPTALRSCHLISTITGSALTFWDKINPVAFVRVFYHNRKRKQDKFWSMSLWRTCFVPFFLMPFILSALISILLEKSSWILAVYFTYNFGVKLLNIWINMWYLVTNPFGYFPFLIFNYIFKPADTDMTLGCLKNITKIDHMLTTPLSRIPILPSCCDVPVDKCCVKLAVLKQSRGRVGSCYHAGNDLAADDQVARGAKTAQSYARCLQ